MNTKIYVGNLPFDITEVELRDLFTPFGTINDAALIMDRETDRPRGFAFVTMGSREEMDSAVSTLSGQEVRGRSLVVNEARPREERPAYSGGNGSGGRGREGRRGGSKW